MAYGQFWTGRLVEMGNDKNLLLAAGGVAAGATGIWALLRWRKYRVLFEPIQTVDGVTIKHSVSPLPAKASRGTRKASLDLTP